MNDPAHFVETLEYRRFAEFCEACRRYRYVGLCYGAPGVGKTLSARHYARWDTIRDVNIYTLPDEELKTLLATGQPDTLLYTVSVTSTPKSIEADLAQARNHLFQIVREPILREHKATMEQQRDRYEEARDAYFADGDWFNLFGEQKPPPEAPAYDEQARLCVQREKAIADPTTLVLVDEADRLKMAGLETLRDSFDRSQIGLILIGMPGIEKRLARYPQFYSRIGFVHEFRPLSATEVRRLLAASWTPPGIRLPPLDEETTAAIVRITGGNFRLLGRLLAQTERIVMINELPQVIRHAVEAARESLVIGHTG
jgi:DNA transposition AAA+ family ATPase